MTGVGGALEDLGRYDEAEKMYRDALALRRALDVKIPDRNLDEPLSDLAMLYSDMGDYPKAREYYGQALAALDADPHHGNPPGEADDSAELKMLRKINALMEEIKILNNTGSVLGNMGDYKADLDYIQRALTLIDTIPTDGVGAYFHADMRAIALGNVATVHADSGQVDLALKEFLDIVDPVQSDRRRRRHGGRAQQYRRHRGRERRLRQGPAL